MPLSHPMRRRITPAVLLVVTALILAGAPTACVSLSEEGLRKRPALLRKSSAAGFVTTKTAKIAHRVLLAPLALQAGEALSEAESPIAMLRPILTASAKGLEEAA